MTQHFSRAGVQRADSCFVAGKSQTIPIFHLKNQYTRNFHLSWLAFFVAFLSWFAFPPLVPEAIKEDLNLTKAELGNSNITALSATLGLRFVTGPLVDRYGPRYVMAALLILGAIPSGLAGTISNATGLYIIRFFIGILGATFVPCQAWTTLFFDKNVVGSANALVGGWGNLGCVLASICAPCESLTDRRLQWRCHFRRPGRSL